MAIRVALHHRTDYYDRPVRLGPRVVRLRPAPHCRTPIVGYGLAVELREHCCNRQQDPADNHLRLDAPAVPPPAELDPELPFTLDLR